MIFRYSWLVLGLLLSSCASKPSTSPIEETGRKMGVSAYKTGEGEIYRAVDKTIASGTRQIFHVISDAGN